MRAYSMERVSWGILCIFVVAVRSALSFSVAPTTSSQTKNDANVGVVVDSSSFRTTTTDAIPKKSLAPNTWFPTRIQNTINYETLVQRLYLRHIVTETRAMAEAALQLAVVVMMTSADNTTTTPAAAADPFGYVASTISTCSATRLEGGKIGWVERNDTLVSASILTTHVIQDLYQLQPKAGDTHILYDHQNERWHVVQVSELWINSENYLEVAAVAKENQQEELPMGSFLGSNLVVPRRKPLKGQGVLPQFPLQMKTYRIQTAGCQMNVADSERLEGILQHDLQLSPALEDDHSAHNTPDLVLFNTCSIRDKAEQKLYDALGPYAALKRQGRQLALIVTGCVAQQEGEALLKRVPEIDAVLGPQYVPHLRNVLEQVVAGHQLVATAPMLWQESNSGGDTGLSNRPIRGHDVRAWVNVVHGCNEHCTYCVVPATRGVEQSRTMESILKECLELGAAGYKEVTLLGQNIDAYGRDMQPKRTFAQLLTFLNDRLPDQMRIRYVTSHPRYFSDRVIDAVADLDKVCECFHMPFQAGDDDVLQRMRRGYTYASYLKIIDKIRAKAPDAAICTDIIVGFPGESEEAFQKTLQLMEEVKFDNVNSFAYSPRPNTEAALWEKELGVADKVKADRLQRVQQLAVQHGLERSERYLGRTVPVLVEDANPRNPKEQVMGRTRQGRQVYFDGDLAQLRGELVDVTITEARTWSLMGVLASTTQQD